MASDEDNPWATWERSFRQQMIRLRESKKMTQTDLARELKQSYFLPFHQQTIQRIESGERPVRLNEAHLIAKTLGVSLDTMTSVATASDLEVRRVVDWLRRSAEVNGHNVAELIGDFDESFDQVIATILDRVSEPSADGTLDPVTHWAVRFAVEAERLITSAMGLREDMLKFGGVDDPDALYLGFISPAALLRERGIDVEQFKGVEFDSNELYQSFPED